MNYISIVTYKLIKAKKTKYFKITKIQDNTVNPLLHSQFNNIVHNGINIIELRNCIGLILLNNDAINPVAAKIK